MLRTRENETEPIEPIAVGLFVFLPNNFQQKIVEAFQHHTTGFLIPDKILDDRFCFQEWSSLFLTEAWYITFMGVVLL